MFEQILSRYRGLVRHWTFWVPWLVILLPAPASTGELRFENLEFDYGYGLESFYRDKKGFVWIGLQNGLLRYDGYRFQMFQADREDPHSLPGNFIQTVIEDRKGYLWLGTRGSGLIRFDRVAMSFKAYKAEPHRQGGLSSDTIHTILEDQDGHLWLGTEGGGLNRFSPESETFEVFKHDESDPYSLSNNNLLTIVEDARGLLWVGTQRGLNRFNPDTGFFTIYLHDPLDPMNLSNDMVSALHKDSNGNIWVGTGGGGLLGYDQGGGLHRIASGSDQLAPICADADDPLEGVVIQAIQEGIDGKMWIGTAEGLIRFDPETCEKNVYEGKPGDPEGLSHNDILSLFLDREQILWIATYYGISLVLPNKQRVSVFSDKKGLSHNEVVCMLEERDEPGHFWLGTRGGGLNFFNRLTGEVRVYPGEKEDGLSHGIVTSLLEDDDGALWIGTKGGGLNRLDPEKKRFSVYRHDPDDLASLNDDVVRTIAMDGVGRMWVGTSTGGVNQFFPKTGKARAYKHDISDPDSISHDFVHVILPDGENKLWLGTLGGGLNHFDPDTGRAVVFRNAKDRSGSLSHDNVTSIFEDTAGMIWVGTLEGGLNRLASRENSVFEHYPSQIDGQDSAIFSIQDDARGYLWLARSHGISRFDPRDGTTVTYGARDGVFDTVYFVGSSHRDSRGTLYFGGLEGMIWFAPEDMVGRAVPPPVELTHFRLYNQEILPNRIKDSPLDKSIEHTSRIALDHGQKSFSISFSALSFADPEGLHYAYRLDPFDPDWDRSPSWMHTAYFANLDPGRYTFRVKAGNRDGVWSGEERQLEILVRPPFWKSTPAFVFYGLCFLVFLYLAWLNFKRRMDAGKRMREVLERQVAVRTKELNQKNLALTNQYRELEVLEEIVKVLNREVKYEDLLRTVLEQGHVLFPMADHGSYLVKDPETENYRIVAAFDQEFKNSVERQFPREALVENYKDDTQEILPSVLLGRSENPSAKHLPGMPRLPRSLVSLGMDDHRDEVLVLGNFEDITAFDNVDLGRLARFREHAVNAISRARVLDDLIRAQRELTESAHSAGMAEMASNVLHNVGNTLNSAQISAHIMGAELNRDRTTELLGKMVSLLQERKHDLSGFFASDPRAPSILPMLERLGEDMDRLVQTCSQEQIRLVEYVDAAISLLREQRAYVDTGQGMIESVDLNAFLRENISREWNRLMARAGEVHYDLKPLPSILIDRARFNRVLFYLLENAQSSIHKRSPDRGGVLGVRTYAEEGSAVLELTDNGVGIEPDRLRNIFSPGKIKGFGLHYCANVMRSMSGTIAVESAGKGLGATVRLTLPFSGAGKAQSGTDLTEEKVLT